MAAPPRRIARERGAAYSEVVHELAIITRVLEIALAAAPEGNAITRVALRVGGLCDADPLWLERYFRIAARSTAAEGAALSIARDEASARCLGCGASWPLSMADMPGAAGLRCPACSSDRAELDAGFDYLLEAIEVREGST
jgi:hydrogenase nickel incorporation protein HypA/HybF